MTQDAPDLPSPGTLFAEPSAMPDVDLNPPIGQLPTLVPRTRPGAIATRPGNGIDAYALLQQAMDRGAGLDVIDKMMALAERLDAMREAQRRRDAEAAYIDALARLKARVVTVVKSKKVGYTSKRTGDTTSYSHATLADIMEAVAEAAADVGLSWNYPDAVIERSGNRATWVTVTCNLRHVEGHAETLTLGGAPDDSGNKNPMQQMASAITYLQRYTLKALLGIAEKDDDDDAGGPPAETTRQLPRAASRRTDAPGGDQVPDEVPEDSPLAALLNIGMDKALGGVKELTAWWGTVSDEDRKLVGIRFGGLKKNAEAIDAKRKDGAA